MLDSRKTWTTSIPSAPLLADVSCRPHVRRSGYQASLWL